MNAVKSAVRYVLNTPWHTLNAHRCDEKELELLIESDYSSWLSYKPNSKLALIVRYEDLVCNFSSTFCSILKHLRQIPCESRVTSTYSTVKKIQNQYGSKSFYRK